MTSTLIMHNSPSTSTSTSRSPSTITTSILSTRSTQPAITIGPLYSSSPMKAAVPQAPQHSYPPNIHFAVPPEKAAVQNRSNSNESSATTCTTTMSNSSRMDWTVASHDPTEEVPDEKDDLEEALVDATSNIRIESEETEQEPQSDIIPDHAPNHPTICSTICVNMDDSHHKEAAIEPTKRDQDERVIPKSVHIHRAIPLPSPSKRIRRSDGGTLRREVSFHQVQIRRYSMIAGDNPACQMGAPVTLDWGYEELPALDLDDFEVTRKKTRRRKLHHLILNYFQRHRILEGMGYTKEEIKIAEKEVSRIRWQRETTRLFLPVSKVEEIIQSVRRKFQRRMRIEVKQIHDELDRSIQSLRTQDSIRVVASSGI